MSERGLSSGSAFWGDSMGGKTTVLAFAFVLAAAVATLGFASQGSTVVLLSDLTEA